jgi:putative MATE family efflux protein
MNNVHRLGYVSPKKLIAEFSLPAIVGMLVQSSYSIIDRIFIGNGAGTMAISGITVCYPIIAVFIAFGMLIGIGGSTLYSIKCGEEKKDECIKIIRNTFLLLAATSVILSLFTGFFLEEILSLFGASGASLQYAKRYLGILLFAIPFQTIGYGMNNLIRSDGRPRMAMATMLIGTVINLILAPILIFVFDAGIKGAAISTVIAQVASCIWVMNYFISTENMRKFHLRNMRISGEITRLTFSIGLGPFFMQIGSCLVAAVYNHQLMNYGNELTLSVYGILHSITVFLLMPVIGISQGSQPIIGYNYGAGNRERVRHIFFNSAKSAFIVLLCGFCAVMAAPGVFVGIFNPSDPELKAAGIHALRVFSFLLPLASLQICTGSYFLATGRSWLSILLTLSRQVFLLLPMLIILPGFYGINGIWMAAPVSDLAAFLITTLILFKEMRKQAPSARVSEKALFSSYEENKALQ